jgi:phenylalanyl-tRNA synthetase beta chain
LPGGADFYALLGVVRKLARLVHAEELSITPLTAATLGEAQFEHWMHPSRAASLSVAGEYFGTIAEVRPDVVSESKQRIVLADISVECLLLARSDVQHFTPLEKYPDSLFEISIVAPEKTYYADIKAMLCQAAPAELLRSIEVVSVYQGAPLPPQKKSVSVKLHFGAADRTLGSDELQQIQNTIMDAVDASAFEMRR